MDTFFQYQEETVNLSEILCLGRIPKSNKTDGEFPYQIIYKNNRIFLITEDFYKAIFAAIKKIIKKGGVGNTETK